MKDSLCTITFQPAGTRIQVPSHTAILTAALQHNIPLEGPCNGRGICGKCLVQVSGSVTPPGDEELERLGTASAGWRLACQAKATGDVTVQLQQDGRFHALEGGQAVNYPFDPPIKSRLNSRLNSPSKLYGVAVDIGTTSIAASLVDLNDQGRETAAAGCLNPQTRVGGDVITRITFANESPENPRLLRDAAVRGINRLIAEMCHSQKVQSKDIYHVVIAGNTTMLHLLLGINPISLAVAPYSPVFVDYRETTARELGIEAAEDSVVSLLPSLSAFVGADILAGMAATAFHHVEVPALFIDIGTNGEIAAKVNGRLAATSAAAGPALEGMNIQFGCRAEDGAISGVKIDSSGEVSLESIGTARRKGICGSGLVELVAELIKAGVLEVSGRFAATESVPGPISGRLVDFHGQRAFVVDPENMILLTQKDVRQVQLAKAAIAAAIEILFQRLGASLSVVERVFIAGAFGYHLKPEALTTLGLLPPGLRGKISLVGNTAKEGARLCLISKQALAEIQTLQKALEPLELSYAPEFMENYVKQMDFPFSQ